MAFYQLSIPTLQCPRVPDPGGKSTALPVPKSFMVLVEKKKDLMISEMNSFSKGSCSKNVLLHNFIFSNVFGENCYSIRIWIKQLHNAGEKYGHLLFSLVATIFKESKW